MAKQAEATVELDDIVQPVEVEKKLKRVILDDPKDEVDNKKVELVSCLKNEKVKITFIPWEGGLVGNDPKHILYGGMHEDSKVKYVVPRLQSGVYVNILTNQEKDFLEYVMGLPKNSLSVYNKVDNYWANKGIYIGKEGITLDLSDPEQYVNYKILLANKEFICPSRDELKRRKLRSYKFYIESEGEDVKSSVESLNSSAKAYLLFGELKESLDKLKLIVEMTTGKVLARNSTAEFVYTQVGKVIKENSKAFINAAEDKFLDTKVLIKEAVEVGLIRKRQGGYYYLAEDNRPLCNEKQEPTLESACVYLNSPKYQDILFSLQARIKE